MSKKLNFDAMSIDEMWRLHEEISRVLSVRLTSEKRELEKRLAQLRRKKEMPQLKSISDRQDEKRRLGKRRKYPRAFRSTEILMSLPKPGLDVENSRAGSRLPLLSPAVRSRNL